MTVDELNKLLDRCPDSYEVFLKNPEDGEELPMHTVPIVCHMNSNKVVFG
jgi:hypothetical protein